jgi:hypothetical protein
MLHAAQAQTQPGYPLRSSPPGEPRRSSLTALKYEKTVYPISKDMSTRLGLTSRLFPREELIAPPQNQKMRMPGAREGGKNMPYASPSRSSSRPAGK